MSDQQHAAPAIRRPTSDKVVSILAIVAAALVNFANSLALAISATVAMFCYEASECLAGSGGLFAAGLLPWLALIGAVVALIVRRRATRLAWPYAVAALFIAIVGSVIGPLAMLAGGMIG